jgi:hypothetical protein
MRVFRQNLCQQDATRVAWIATLLVWGTGYVLSLWWQLLTAFHTGLTPLNSKYTHPAYALGVYLECTRCTQGGALLCINCCIGHSLVSKST